MYGRVSKRLTTTRPAAGLPLLWKRWMQRLRWVAHPITIFVALQVVWLALLLMWVIWFVGQQESISQLSQRFGGEYFDSRTVIIMLIVGCVLLGVLLVGTIVLFVFGQRQSYVARQQRDFVSSVTHELKSPLASLQLAFETLMTRRLSDEHNAKMMDMVSSDIERLRRLVDQILVAGRLDRGVTLQDEDSQPIAFAELIERIADRLTYLDPQLRGRLTISAPAGLTLKAPRSTLTLILNNLLENAVKYSPREAPISVTATVGDGTVTIRVEDQGHGLDKRDMRRIFKMFHRGESAVKKAIPGTGLGLYIVRTSVHLLGGRVWAKSDGRGRGTTFFTSLPLTTTYVSEQRTSETP